MQSRHVSPPIPAGAATDAMPDALLVVLVALSRLSIDGGLGFGQLEALLKRALVVAALQTAREAGAAADVPVSRLSVMTGIHRREVKRIVDTLDRAPLRYRQARVTELFTRWVTGAGWQDPAGRPLVLPRRIDRDDVLSFEKLAREVTTDVHPKSLLDELVRLGLALHDPVHDTVALRATDYVPTGELAGLLALAGGSLADHVSAVRANLEAARRGAGPDESPCLEQSIFADALSEVSALDGAIRATHFWRELLRTMAPELQRLEDEDRRAGRPTTHRLRVGMYCYAEVHGSDAGEGGKA